MRMRFLATAAILLIAATTSVGRLSAQQRPAWLQQYSWAQVQTLNAVIERYARRDRITTRALGAISEAVSVSRKAVSFDKLVELIEAKSREAAKFKREIAALQQQVAALPDPALRDPAAAALVRANQAFDEGRLDEAEAEFAKLQMLRRSQTSDGFAAWASSTNALIAIAQLRSRYDDATQLGLRKAADAVAVARFGVKEGWSGLVSAAYSQRLKAALLGPIEGLLSAQSIYEKDMVRFLKEFPDAGREQMRRLALAEVLSSINSRGGGIELYRQSNDLLIGYLSYVEMTDCPDCIARAVGDLSFNISNIIFQTRDISYLNAVLPYLTKVDRIKPGSVSNAELAPLYVQQAGLFGMAGEIGRSAVMFDRAEQLAIKAIAAYSVDPSSIDGKMTLGDIYRQRGEYLRKYVYYEKSLVIYDQLVAAYTTKNMMPHVGLVRKRMGAVRYGLATARKDCSLLRQSNEDIDKALQLLNQQDYPGERAGLVVMRDRGAKLIPQLCR